ncbi:uncharacterized protein LY89DRAFT_662643 [Mollisia scopiformis]|uniref:Uncharacterized protein n=1 Tax=Mollisia scopiformis TaxID=149040 RepID=A0A194XU53_MOLSC|nr:uncharacterized protein LY89DRAFT_662643 [Mollisia scopiformis]KUJ23850.1 hypothetical protein LY89DRAFT_662643 [Mollisia scopiformis]
MASRTIVPSLLSPHERNNERTNQTKTLNGWNLRVRCATQSPLPEHVSPLKRAAVVNSMPEKYRTTFLAHNRKKKTLNYYDENGQIRWNYIEGVLKAKSSESDREAVGFSVRQSKFEHYHGVPDKRPPQISRTTKEKAAILKSHNQKWAAVRSHLTTGTEAASPAHEADKEATSTIHSHDRVMSEKEQKEYDKMWGSS